MQHADLYMARFFSPVGAKIRETVEAIYNSVDILVVIGVFSPDQFVGWDFFWGINASNVQRRKLLAFGPPKNDTGCIPPPVLFFVILRIKVLYYREGKNILIYPHKRW